MKTYLHIAQLVLLTATLASCSTPPEQPSNLNIERTNSMSSFATVEAIDMKTRMVTLQGPEGDPFTIHAGEEVVNLPQVHPGDKVQVTYSESLTVRMAAPGETKNEITGIIGRAEPGSKPAGVGITETTITATIHEIDTANGTATLEMADGSYRIVKVQDPSYLDKVKVGDTIAITYQEAVGIIVSGKDQ